MNKIDVKSLLLQELKQCLSDMGEKPFRAAQIFKWLHLPVSQFNEMTDLSVNLRKRLDDVFYITVPYVVEKQISKIDDTVKYLWKLWDGQLVESVLMRYNHGHSVCISCQVGCRMGCRFCASGILGLERNLSAGEILDQILFINRDMNIKISNIVMMGIGEPLDNYDNVVKFLHIVNHPLGINISHRHVSLSTCGLCDKISELGDERLQITLSVSLHNCDNNKRSNIMPINKRYGVEELMDCCKIYFEKTHRRISFEYTMIREISDSVESAHKLGRLLKGQVAHVNLIKLNDVVESGLKPSCAQDIMRFKSIVESYGVTVTQRRTLGKDIDASCGQLRRREINRGER